MAKPLALGALGGGINPPDGDLANSVAQGVFTATGTSEAVQFYGAFNLMLWASLVDALTTTAGSANATVASGTGLAAGSAINSANVPPGTTVATISALNIALNFPTISLQAKYLAGTAQITDLPYTAGLVGAAITGPGWPAGATVTGILTPFAAGPNGGNQLGVVSTSVAPTLNSAPAGNRVSGSFNSSGGNDRILFALGPQSVETGTDNAAIFTGTGIQYAGSAQLEYSVDGGATWVLANIGGGGQQAIYGAGTPVRTIVGEVEQGMGYRVNCTVLTGGNINWRMSTTGQAAVTLAIPSGV